MRTGTKVAKRVEREAELEPVVTLSAEVEVELSREEPTLGSLLGFWEDVPSALGSGDVHQVRVLQGFRLTKLRRKTFSMSGGSDDEPISAPSIRGRRKLTSAPWLAFSDAMLVMVRMQIEAEADAVLLCSSVFATIGAGRDP